LLFANDKIRIMAVPDRRYATGSETAGEVSDKRQLPGREFDFSAARLVSLQISSRPLMA
jgi:hypothetical protein